MENTPHIPERSPARCRNLFPRYAHRYESWRQVARSLPNDVDLDAMADAARDERRRRHATRPELGAEGSRR